MIRRSSVFYCTGILLLVALLSASMFLNGNVLADDAVDSVVITVPAACTFSNTTTGEDYTLSVTPGNYDTVGDTSFQVVCNDSNGFSVYAVGYSNDEYGNTDMVSGVAANPNILTGASTQGGTSAWAMKLTPVSGTYAPTIPDGTNNTEDFTDFHAVPSTFTKVATFPSLTDSTIGSSFQSTYRVYVSPSQAPDTYVGKVRYTVVHPDTEIPLQPQACEAGKICYFPNSSSTVGGMDVLQTISSTVTLWPSNFSRDGYGFAGWSTTYDYSDPTGFYGPMETISLNTSDYTTNGLSLYAHWVPAETGVTMQTFNPDTSPYSTKPIGTVIALKDVRDNDTYAVAKLADGKWWMIENLRLDYDANITPANTQSNNGSFGGVFIGLAEAEGPWVDGNTAANSLYTTEIDIPGKNTISGNNLDYRFPRYNNDNTSSRVSGSSYSVYRNVYSYGNYYTWAAAAADTSDYVGSGQLAVNTSICPNGWGLPYGRNTGDGNTPGGFYYLNYKINGDSNGQGSLPIRRYPNNILISGQINNSSIYGRDDFGNYWSSTGLFNCAYYLSLSKGSVGPGTSDTYRFRGLNVRCVAGN